jgi:hypothetical protein
VLASVGEWFASWTWSAPVADWLQGIGAVAALIAAGLVYCQVQRQIRQADLQHNTSLRGAHRPLIVVRQARLIRGRYPMDSTGNLTLQVTIGNIGPGPAVGAKLRAWLRDVPVPARQCTIDEMKSSIDLDAPEFFVRTDSLAAGELMILEASASEANPPGTSHFRRPVLFYLPTYADLFENEFPSRPRSEWAPGSYLFPLDWSISDESGSGR